MMCLINALLQDTKADNKTYPYFNLTKATENYKRVLKIEVDVHIPRNIFKVQKVVLFFQFRNLCMKSSQQQIVIH